jgi:brefeldin A-inhibited guanine nucleotide-exchange protein
MLDAWSGGFKGLGLASGDVPGKNGIAINPHTLFLHSKLLPLLEKLLRETRTRKTKDVNTNLQSAILALRTFLTEDWPPSKAGTTTNPETGAAQATSGANAGHTISKSPMDGVHTEADVKTVTNDTTLLSEETEEEETQSETTIETEVAEPPEEAPRIPDVKAHASEDAAVEEITEHPAETDQVEPTSVPPEQPGAIPGLEKPPAPTSDYDDDGIPKDDPQTREPVHESVVSTLEVLMQILQHPSKTNKSVEYILDAINLLVSYRYVSGRAGGRDDVSGSGSQTAVSTENETDDTVVQELSAPSSSLLHRLLESVAKCSEILNVDVIHICLIKTLTSIMTSPKCGVHEASMLLCLKATFHVFLVTKSQTAKDMSKAALLDMLRSVFSRMEAYDVIVRSRRHHLVGSEASETEIATDTSATLASQIDLSTGSTGSENSGTYRPPPFTSQYHTDSYVLFRALCKMSAKELPADTTDSESNTTSNRLFSTSSNATDPMALNNKLLSLDLILSSLDYCGDAFGREPRFLHLVQHYLCVSLLQNCMSHQTQVAFLSQKIFLILVHKFKGHLKQEIEVFLSNIFLRVLDSPNSSFKQKALVLESLRSLCRDPTLLTQIFLNYDCDFNAMNLYKDIVHQLTKLGGKATTTLSSSFTKKEAEEEFELSLAGMEVLVTILKAFLRALALPGGEDDTDDTAGAAIRGILQLDVGLAATSKSPIHPSTASSASSVVSEELPKSDGNESAEGNRSAQVAGRIVDAFEMKRNAEQNFEIGAVKFTLSLKGGLAFFIANGFVRRNARDIALFFLRNRDKLDKTQMGEALGREPDAAFVKEEGLESDNGGPGFWVRILHHYADALDLSGLPFDEAIRLFLSGFRLPGEAQKIDRIMEKFAEKFTSQNPDLFPSADTAFILAFSVIMLNTDLHNPSIKPERRMTVDSFVRNNSGIGQDGGDLPKEFLEEIFDRIKEQPFSLKEDDAAREKAGAHKQIFDTSVFFERSTFSRSTADDKKREMFKKEKNEMMAVTQRLIRLRPDQNNRSQATSLTDTISPSDVVKPMFDVTWGPMIGILSQVLECSDDERAVAVCLNGFVYAVRIAAHSKMSLARDTFVSSLAKFTFLGSLKEMKRKNVESIRTLLSIAVIDGDFLNESWGPVLQCISQLARLRLTASGLDSDESFLVEKEKAKKAATPNRGREAEESNGRAVLEAVQEVLIFKVFSSSVSLSAKSLGHFISELIAVSESEIAGNSKQGITGMEPTGNGTEATKKIGDGPAIFSLQRLVEVADYNMNVRPRLVWAQIWVMMADYFAKIACHENAFVSVFAIDSLKQLSFKFLEKPELSEFNFQRLFLKPFLVVMEDPCSREDGRELVLRCIDNMIRTKAYNLRSGWKVVFSILTRSATDPSEKIDYLGLATLQRLLDDHLNDLFIPLEDTTLVNDLEALSALERRNRNSNVDDFVGLCKASLSFVQREDTDSPRPAGLSMRAFCHTAIYSDLLAAKRILPAVSGEQFEDREEAGYTYPELDRTEALEMVLWRPLLEGLADGIRSTLRSSAGGVGCIIQRGSVLALRAILLRHGHIFSTNQIAAILKYTVIPAIQAGAEADKGSVVSVTSESPSISNIDFLVDPYPIPPPPDDVSLLRFEAMNTTPHSRSLGPAELMLEASFSDLRHCGDGDLRRAFILAKKAAAVAPKVIEQAFPDSWIATTAPVALGLLTDIVSELCLERGLDGREKVWSLICNQYTLWYLGRDNPTWTPCEALVRIACQEMRRFPKRLAEFSPKLESSEATAWSISVCLLFSKLLSESSRIQMDTCKSLVHRKEKALVVQKSKDTDTDSLDDVDDIPITTPYGKGLIVKNRNDRYRAEIEGGADIFLEMNVISLDFGASLFSPVEGSVRKVIPLEDDRDISSVPSTGQDRLRLSGGIPREVNVPNAYWQELVPILKIRCVAAHCLQESLAVLIEDFVLFLPENVVVELLKTLNGCRAAAQEAARDEDVATAFQEALFHDWGDGVAEVEQALESAARLSHLHGSAMFFLAQEASATQALVSLLSPLYLHKQGRGTLQVEEWGRKMFAEPHVMAAIKEVTNKFLESEEKDGHLIDPNVWRNLQESGGKVALYCTFFGTVVVNLLKLIRSVEEDQFSLHLQEFFPILCSLVLVQSDEIRKAVQEILQLQVAPLLQVKV